MGKRAVKADGSQDVHADKNYGHACTARTLRAVRGSSRPRRGRLDLGGVSTEEPSPR